MTYIEEATSADFGFPGGLLVLFGGSRDNTLQDPGQLILEDLWMFDLAVRRWTPLRAINTAPAERTGSLMTAVGMQVVTVTHKPLKGPCHN